MKIRSLKLAQFKKFDQPTIIEGFADGLNLIAGPNEMGKSTLLLALRAALFERHASKTQSIKALQPNHAKGAKPSIKVELEIAGSLYTIEKQFLRSPEARLTYPDGRVAEGNEAERAIQELLGLEKDGTLPLDKGSPGHFGVMLIPQSQSFYQPTLSDGTRHTLEEAITVEIEQLGNQSEVDAVLANVELAAFEFVDRRSKPKGRFREVEARLGELASEIEALGRDRDDLAEDIAALNDAEARLRSLESGEPLEALQARLADLERRRTELYRRKEIDASIKAAQFQVERLIMNRDQRLKQQAERAGLVDEQARLFEQETAARAELVTLETELADQMAKRQALIDAEQAIQEKRRSFEQLNAKLNQQAEIGNALQAIATEVTIDLDSAALDRVRLNDQPMERSNEIVQVVDGLDIEIEGVGRIKVQPKLDQLARLREHQANLDRSITDLTQALDLRSAGPEPIEVAWRETEEEAAAIAARRADLDEVLDELGKAIGERKPAVLAMTSGRRKLDERLAALRDERERGEGDREQTEGPMAEALAEAEAELAAVRQAAADPRPAGEPAPIVLDELEAMIDTQRRRIEDRAKMINEARVTIGRLGGSVAVRAGRGLDERLDECCRRRDMLLGEQACFQLDARALGLLKETLTAAANDAKAHFHAPLAARLTPYVQALLPEAEPEVTPDFGITALHRGKPVSERFEQLSDGTREQIAILARLAFAQMLKEQGLPALVVLDDALVFSDQQRLARMFAILEKAATSLQIIILTCHEDRFRGLKAKHLAIQQRAAAA